MVFLTQRVITRVEERSIITNKATPSTPPNTAGRRALEDEGGVIWSGELVVTKPGSVGPKITCNNLIRVHLLSLVSRPQKWD